MQRGLSAHEVGGYKVLNTRRKAAAACVEAVPFCAWKAYTLPCLIHLSSLSDYVIREAKRPGEGLSNPRGAQSMEAGKKGTEPS